MLGAGVPSNLKQNDVDEVLLIARYESPATLLFSPPLNGILVVDRCTCPANFQSGRRST